MRHAALLFLYTIVNSCVLANVVTALLLRDFELDIPGGNKDDNVSLPLYVSYSHNPWANSKQINQHEGSPPDSGGRSKRSILHLYNMVVCSTGCNPLAYKGYGCFCGFLGSGNPVDSIDRCCKMHDWCYNSVNCPMFLQYFVPYVWTCYKKQPLCAKGTLCSKQLCECDKQFAQCLKDYRCPRSKAVCRTSPWRLFQKVVLI